MYIPAVIIRIRMKKLYFVLQQNKQQNVVSVWTETGSQFMFFDVRDRGNRKRVGRGGQEGEVDSGVLFEHRGRKDGKMRKEGHKAFDCRNSSFSVLRAERRR